MTIHYLHLFGPSSGNACGIPRVPTWGSIRLWHTDRAPSNWFTLRGRLPDRKEMGSGTSPAFRHKGRGTQPILRRDNIHHRRSTLPSRYTRHDPALFWESDG